MDPSLSNRVFVPSIPQGTDGLGDVELDKMVAAERKRAEVTHKLIAELKAEWHRHETRRRQLARELLRRAYISSPFGRVLVESVLPFLEEREVLRWFVASPAAAAQVCATEDPTRRQVHHIRHVASDLSKDAARSVVGGLHGPSIWSIAIDLSSFGWAQVLEAFATEGKQLRLSGLRRLFVAFPAERSAAMLQRWLSTAPLLACLGERLLSSPLQELVLTDLRSAEMLTTALRCGGAHLRVCRASFIGPESRKKPLELPATGLPALQCLMIRHRDFCEQRTSRQERMTVSASSLAKCLESIDAPEKLQILALAGIRIDGSHKDTAALLHGLLRYPGLVAVALRFSVPATFGTLLPFGALVDLRCAWPLLGHFVLGDMSLHGFDYWPEQVTDFRELYPHGNQPKAFEVFSNEFSDVLSVQYRRTAEQAWVVLKPIQQSFWADVARRLPNMPHSELRQRVSDIFPHYV